MSENVLQTMRHFKSVIVRLLRIFDGFKYIFMYLYIYFKYRHVRYLEAVNQH